MSAVVYFHCSFLGFLSLLLYVTRATLVCVTSYNNTQDQEEYSVSMGIVCVCVCVGVCVCVSLCEYIAPKRGWTAATLPNYLRQVMAERSLPV